LIFQVLLHFLKRLCISFIYIKAPAFIPVIRPVTGDLICVIRLDDSPDSYRDEQVWQNKKAAVTPLSFHQTSVMFKPSCYDLFKLQSLMINCQQKYDGDRLLETFNE